MSGTRVEWWIFMASLMCKIDCWVRMKKVACNTASRPTAWWLVTGCTLFFFFSFFFFLFSFTLSHGQVDCALWANRPDAKIVYARSNKPATWPFLFFLLPWWWQVPTRKIERRGREKDKQECRKWFNTPWPAHWLSRSHHHYFYYCFETFYCLHHC